MRCYVLLDYAEIIARWKSGLASTYILHLLMLLLALVCMCLCLYCVRDLRTLTWITDSWLYLKVPSKSQCYNAVCVGLPRAMAAHLYGPVSACLFYKEPRWPYFGHHSVPGESVAKGEQKSEQIEKATRGLREKLARKESSRCSYIGCVIITVSYVQYKLQITHPTDECHCS